MKMFDIKSVKEHTKEIFQEVGSDAQLLQRFTGVFRNFQDSKNATERQERLAKIKEYLQVLEPQHLEAVEKVVKTLESDLDFMGKQKQTSSLKEASDFISTSGSDEEVCFQLSKQASFQELMKAIAEAKEGLENQKGLVEIQRLYKNQ
jgi:hypothetical protein